MAKLSYQDLGELTTADVSNIGKAIVLPAKDALRQLRFALTGNLTIRDNAYAAIVTLGYTGNSTQTLTSGTEYTFQNPLKTKPIGFTPIQCMNANGGAIAAPPCKLNTSRTDGLIGVTPIFPHNGEKIELALTSSTSITHGAIVDVSWSGIMTANGVTGSIYSWTSGANITVSEAGLYLCHVKGLWAFSASGGTRRMAVALNGTEVDDNCIQAITVTDDTRHEVNYQINCVSGSAIGATAFQRNGGAGALNLVGSGTLAAANVNRTKMTITRIANLESGILTGILWGG